MENPNYFLQIAEFLADNPWIPPLIIGLVLAWIIIKFLPRG